MKKSGGKGRVISKGGGKPKQVGSKQTDFQKLLNGWPPKPDSKSKATKGKK